MTQYEGVRMHFTACAALVNHASCMSFYQAAKCLDMRCDVTMRITPVPSAQELAQLVHESRGLDLLVADVGGRGKAGPSEEIRALATIAGQPSAPPLVVILPHGSRPLVSRLSRLGVREVVPPEEENRPAGAALILSRVLLPAVVRDFLEGLPAPTLHPDYLLSLLYGVMFPTNEFDEVELARRAGRDLARVRADFGRAGAAKPCAFCRAAVLYRLAHERRRLDGPLRDVLGLAGFRTQEGLRRWCGGLLCEDPIVLVSGADPGAILNSLQEAARRRAVEARPADGTGAPPALARADEMASLYERSFPLMLKAARRHGASPEEAADLAHDVVVAVLAQDSGRKFTEGYFVAAVVNRLRDRRRKAGRRASSPPPEASVVGEVPDPEGRLEVQRHRALLRSVVRGLSEPHRTAFRLSGLLRWKPAEVGRMIGKSRKAVALMRDRSRREVRCALTEHERAEGAEGSRRG